MFRHLRVIQPSLVLFIVQLAFFSLGLLPPAVSTTHAQDDTSLEYGQVATGEITNQNYEVTYAFVGTAGDIIVVEMTPVDAVGDLQQPDLVLLDPHDDIVGDTSETFTYGGATLAAQLAENGTYSVIATRADGRAGDSVGDYTLEVINVPLLEVGSVVSESVSNQERNNYYAVINDGKLMLSYTKQDGDFAPYIIINSIGSEGELNAAVSLFGSDLERGDIGIPSISDIFIISVGRASLIAYREATATYDLELRAS